MAFIFSKTVRDIIRERDLFQSIHDAVHKKKRGDSAPQKLPNLAIHGVISNGTYFFCNLVYQKSLTERKKITIFNLIDAYANTEEHAERIKLKAQIKEACGEHVEGIALLFSNSSGTYGFVTGNRVKVAGWSTKELLELDADELFSDSENRIIQQHFIFILENEEEFTSELINQYFQGNQIDDNINTDVINAIKYIDRLSTPLEDMNRYLKTAYAAIQNPILQQQVKAVFDALQLLSYDDSEVKYKATVLTLQLLHSQDDEKRKQLLTDYTNLASTLYGSKIPTKMIAGISLFLLGAIFLTLAILTSPAIPLYLYTIILFSSSGLMTGGLIRGIVGANEFFNDETKQKRSTANMEYL